MTELSNKLEVLEDNLFENDIDEEVYTHRKTSYKMGKLHYPLWKPEPHWDEERRIQYRNGWSYAEWLNERTCI